MRRWYVTLLLAVCFLLAGTASAAELQNLEVDGNTLSASVSGAGEASLFAAVYDGGGTMVNLYSVSVQGQEASRAQPVTLNLTVPEGSTVKGFLVETRTMQPLCGAVLADVNPQEGGGGTGGGNDGGNGGGEDEAEYYAVLYEDGGMVFQKGDTPEADRAVWGKWPVYPDYQPSAVASPSDARNRIPWREARGRVRSVSFKDPIQPRNLSCWFEGFANMTDFDSTNLDVSRTTAMMRTFYQCENIKELDLSSWDVSRVADMKEMFRDCWSLNRLSLSDWDTGSVVTMEWMFAECGYYLDLDLTGWNTENLADTTHMFYSAGVRTLNLSGWNTSQLKTMQAMFQSAALLQSVDLTGWDTSHVRDMSELFYGCGRLKTVWVSRTFTWSGLKPNSYNDNFFFGCNALTGMYGSSIEKVRSETGSTLGLTDISHAVIDGGSRYGYFSERDCFHVQFDANGGRGYTGGRYVDKGESWTLRLNHFTRDGFAFGGWNTAADGSGTAYADGADITPEEDVTLYAQWRTA